jgi:cytochrome c1
MLGARNTKRGAATSKRVLIGRATSRRNDRRQGAANRGRYGLVPVLALASTSAQPEEQMSNWMKATGIAAALMMVAPMVSFGADAKAPDKKAERVWKAKCSSCHGMDGKAATEQGKKAHVRDMTTPEYQKITDEKIKEALAKGAKSDTGTMEAYTDLSAEQVDMLVNYVRWLGTKK